MRWNLAMGMDRDTCDMNAWVEWLAGLDGELSTSEKARKGCGDCSQADMSGLQMPKQHVSIAFDGQLWDLLTLAHVPLDSLNDRAGAEGAHRL